jgi:hypothetical protein
MYTRKNKTSPLSPTLYKNEVKLLVFVHLDWFQSLAIVISATIKVDVQVFSFMLINSTWIYAWK